MKSSFIKRLATVATLGSALAAGILLADDEKGRADSAEEQLREILESDEDFLKDLLDRAALDGGNLQLEIEGEDAQRFLEGDGDILADKLKELLRDTTELDLDELERAFRDKPARDRRRLDLDSDGKGMADFLDFFQAQTEGMAPGKHEKDHRAALAEWLPVVKKASKSTATVLDSTGQQIALATVVDRRGYLVTKASELPEGSFAIDFGDGKELKGKRLDVNKTWDLALIKVRADKLTPVEFAEGSDVPLGSFLAASGSGDYPVATGVASVAPRNLSRSERGYLGIAMKDDGDTVRISEVVGRSAASRAGLKAGDVVLRINNMVIDSSAHLASMVSGYFPGDKVGVRYLRDGKERDLEVELGKLEMRGPRVDPNQFMGGPLSEMRSEFPRALQHDLTLAPEECGGPLVNTEGRTVGVNIARGGRVKSFAIPAADLKRLLGDLDSGRFTIVDSRAARRELESVDKEIEEIEKRLKAARERRKAAEEALEKVRP